MAPEVIIKQQFTIDATGDIEFAVPEILVLGNRDGLRQLGHWLLGLAEREPQAAHAYWDPDDHQHLTTKHPPFNLLLSDELEFRFGILTESNRGDVLDKYGISESTKQAGHLCDRYQGASRCCGQGSQPRLQ